MTFVTYDRGTIPPLLKVWAEEERSHGGVLFVDEKTISPTDIGGLVRALISLAAEGFLTGLAYTSVYGKTKGAVHATQSEDFHE
ncbi:MAG TPA: hypothetical protein VN577_23070 [Terriglobales bacterium]|nr:hypothetical protein [Terriglobales bacterium]